MSKALLLILDSLGIGAAPDADRFGDRGADTLGHIVAHCATGRADVGRHGALQIPNLEALGLLDAWAAAHGRARAFEIRPGQCHAVLQERSSGKDTTSGHWELCGLPVQLEWGYFRKPDASMPAAFLDAWCVENQLTGVLGNCHASGTEIIQRLGPLHIETGQPIVYTSADSVFQVAVHERHFGLERLDAICRSARRMLDPYNIARVISRPFIGPSDGMFKRTGNRHDYSMPPPGPTLLDAWRAQGREVIGIGKIPDIFAGVGVSKAVPAHGLNALLDATLKTFADAPSGSLVFCNLVDFDSEYGHRRDVPGYARALEYFDQRLPELLALRQPGDLIAISADHGNDPSWPGSDHTRECVPLLLMHEQIIPGFAGIRTSFADLGQTLAQCFRLPPLAAGTSLPWMAS
ncbi:phosphopentomutase [Ahniella affigens]|uniref:Phosphopentomutase n=1 Tax=Ahniella affigens TaxID=2021234 RepID=A0A2P1PVU3_9GAMM|nr:phosphopentomutase [Ahniella affigens]AVP98950.1 phosphopentomutase [Ahniella affigens]